MATPPLVPRPHRRWRESSWFAFGATTTALVLLATGGTAVLVHFGVDEGRDPQRAHPAALPATGSARGGASVTVDRVVGSFRAASPQPPRTAQDGQTLASLLLPVLSVGDVTPEQPLAPEPPAPVLVPEPPPLPLGPPPEPTPPTVHPPVLPMPNPAPIPLPVPLPLPLPLLPALPLPLPPGS